MNDDNPCFHELVTSIHDDNPITCCNCGDWFEDYDALRLARQKAEEQWEKQ